MGNIFPLARKILVSSFSSTPVPSHPHQQTPLLLKQLLRHSLDTTSDDANAVMMTADDLPKSGADGPDRGEVERIVKWGKGLERSVGDRDG